jgi:DNA-binding response OmpR family regulator
MNGDQPWVLLVEDDPQVRLAIRWTLEAEGIVVEDAPTGQKAIQLASRRAPNLVLLDIDLPDISGYAVADSLRTAHGNLPILVLTADRAAEKAVRAGAIAYLTKPFESEDLIAEVTRALG